MKKTKKNLIWCDTCQTWHKVSSWDEQSQFENWGCALDLAHTPVQNWSRLGLQFGFIGAPAGLSPLEVARLPEDPDINVIDVESGAKGDTISRLWWELKSGNESGCISSARQSFFPF